MTEFSKPEVTGICLGDSEDKFRLVLGLKPDDLPSGTIILSGHCRDVGGFLGGGVLQELEIETLEEGDTFLGIDLTGDPEEILKKIQRKGYEAFDDGAGIVVPELNASMYVSEDEIQSVCWSLPVPKREAE